jgi:dTDP-4-dehydrorhamnose 3,5-epimerase-like enzyme
MTGSTVADCRLMDLPKLHRVAGNITAINNHEEIPFAVSRVYYLYDVPGGESRGGHGHRALEQLVVAAMGSFDIVLKDSRSERRISLSKAYQGLYVPPGIWRELENFSSGAICLVLASTAFDESDYFRKWSDFVRYKQNSPEDGSR